MFDAISTLGLAGVSMYGDLEMAAIGAVNPRRRPRANRRERPACLDTAHPVLLLHGFASSPEVMAPLARRIEARLGRRVVLVRTSAGRDDIRDCAREVASVLEQLASEPGFEFADAVGHSMGGLVATWLLKKIDGGRRLRRVVTLGSPHRGAPLAAAAACLLVGRSRAMRQMIPGSNLLRDLEWARVPAASSLLSIAGDADQLVPVRFASVTPMQGQTNLVIAGVAHLRLVFSTATLRALCDAISDATVLQLPASSALSADSLAA